ncbi:hypothetical protein AVEN_178979-1, partial [Araneus ventricosus]
MGPAKKPPFSGQSSPQSYTFNNEKRIISQTDENFGTVSPFLVEKAITGSVGIVSSTKLMRSCDLLVEVASRKQAQQILKLNSLSTIPVFVMPHLTLNTSKGVITCGRLLNLSNEEITQELSGQGPEYIKAGYVRCSVRPYIPNPLRCFKCQRFGHSKTSCRGTLTCARCAVAGHESTGCTAAEKCVNCQGTHTSFSRACPKWELEKEIVTLKFKNNIPFPEARRLVKARTPIEGQSYASVVDKNHPAYQTTHCPHCHHVVTMSNFPSASKSSEPIASSSTAPNRNTSRQSSSRTPEVSPASQDPSGFQIVKSKKKPKYSSTIQSVKNNQLKPDTASKFLKKSLSDSVAAQDKSSKNKNDINET